MKRVSIEEIKVLDINQWLQQKYPPNIEDLVGVHIEREFLIKECEKDGTQILKFLKGKVTVGKRKIQVWVV